MATKFNVPEADIQHYIAPELSGNIVGMKESALRPQTVEEIEALQKKAYDEARKEGYQKGLNEAKQNVNKLQNMLNFLNRPLEELDEEVEHQLAELAIMLAKQLLKKECSIDAEHIYALVNDSLSYLPVKSRDIKVHLNPADIELMNKLDMQMDEQSWKCISDSSVSVGGCVIESDTSHIDASIETRVQQLVEQLDINQAGINQADSETDDATD